MPLLRHKPTCKVYHISTASRELTGGLRAFAWRKTKQGTGPVGSCVLRTLPFMRSRHLRPAFTPAAAPAGLRLRGLVAGHAGTADPRATCGAIATPAGHDCGVLSVLQLCLTGAQLEARLGPRKAQGNLHGPRVQSKFAQTAGCVPCGTRTFPGGIAENQSYAVL